MAKSISISCQELRAMNSINLSGKAKRFSSYAFWYYSSLDTVNKILLSKSFYVSNLALMNDKDEIDLHPDTKEIIHSLCFCNSASEKIPMWYLYSGIAGNGAAIGLSPATMLKFIRSIEYVYTIGENEQKLLIGKDIELQYGWIFYQKSSEVLYKNKWYALKNPEEFHSENYFVKSYPWEYEKEFRIVFINKSGNKLDRVKVLIPDFLIRELKIRVAPEISDDELRKILPSLNGFQDFLMSKLEKSGLKINMNLCKRNFDSFVSYIEHAEQSKNSDELNEQLNKLSRVLVEKGFPKE